jgi:hypothetical protein
MVCAYLRTGSVPGDPAAVLLPPSGRSCSPSADLVPPPLSLKRKELASEDPNPNLNHRPLPLDLERSRFRPPLERTTETGT